MKFWNRRNKIEFFHNEPSIIENFPIIESKDLKLNWVKGARKHFQKTALVLIFPTVLTCLKGVMFPIVLTCLKGVMLSRIKRS